MAKHHLPKHHPRLHINFVESFAYFFAVTTPLFELPQVYQIYASHSARDVSFATWFFFEVSSIAWLIYGIKRNILAITISSALYVVIETVIVVGILIYR